MCCGSYTGNSYTSIVCASSCSGGGIGSQKLVICKDNGDCPNGTTCHNSTTLDGYRYCG